MIITHGLPGSGKTTFSQLALEQMGAIRIRSDVERKRLFGLGTLESSRARVGDIYSPEATRRTYARLHELARELLAAGFPVIVDAAFLKREERETFRKLAQSMSVPFAIASLHAGDSMLRERIRQRRNDASEADVAVLDMLQATQQPLSLGRTRLSQRDSPPGKLRTVMPIRKAGTSCPDCCALPERATVTKIEPWLRCSCAFHVRLHKSSNDLQSIFFGA